VNVLSPELLHEIVQRLVDEFHPERIILFGSHAWGTPTNDSDIDLLGRYRVVPASLEAEILERGRPLYG
jgi:predicted nucleotidyltransferase